MFIRSLISIRDFFVSNFFVSVIGFKKSNNYLWIGNKGIFQTICYTMLMVIPLFITTYITKICGYDVIYKYDNIYNLSNSKSNKIIPVLLEFKAYSSEETAYFYDLSKQIKFYNTSIPFNVFVVLNIPKIYDSIKIKYLTKGAITEKNFLINDYKNHLIYNLFEN